MAKYGPAGGQGGAEFDLHAPVGRRIIAIVLWAGQATPVDVRTLRGIQLEYDLGVPSIVAGSTRNLLGAAYDRLRVALNGAEEWTGLSGQYGNVIDKLVLSKTGGETEWGGPGGGTHFNLPVPPGTRLVGVFGKSGNAIDSVGIHAD